MFYDTHAHLDYPEFASELPDVISRARSAGITRMLSIGTDLESSRRAISLAEAHPEIYAVVGWHPGYVTSAPENIENDLRELGRHPKVVALGEAGLDYYRLPSKESGNDADDLRYKERQAELFRQHLRVAAELKLNLVIHQRSSLEPTLAIFEEFADQVCGVFHCFSEPPEIQKRIAAMGSLVSFTGIVTFKNGENVRRVVSETPLGQFMLETDCPYLAPVPYRGQRCEPAHVREIAQKIAEVKNCDLETLSRATCETAQGFFPKLK